MGKSVRSGGGCNDGQEPMRSNRNTLTFELAVNLRLSVVLTCQLAQIIPCYDGFPEQEKMAYINKRGQKIA